MKNLFMKIKMLMNKNSTKPFLTITDEKGKVLIFNNQTEVLQYINKLKEENKRLKSQLKKKDAKLNKLENDNSFLRYISD